MEYTTCDGEHFTPYRKFLAWVGFLSLILYTIALVGAVLWANHFININI